jgi:SlyX protein
VYPVGEASSSWAGKRGVKVDRVEALEERVAHLMRAVEDLSDVVAAQATEIAGLERRVRLLMERAAEEEAQGGAPEANVRPPHW